VVVELQIPTQRSERKDKAKQGSVALCSCSALTRVQMFFDTSLGWLQCLGDWMDGYLQPGGGTSKNRGESSQWLFGLPLHRGDR